MKIHYTRDGKSSYKSATRLPHFDFHGALTYYDVSATPSLCVLDNANNCAGTHGVYLGHTVVGPSLPGLEPLTYSFQISSGHSPSVRYARSNEGIEPLTLRLDGTFVTIWAMTS